MMDFPVTFYWRTWQSDCRMRRKGGQLPPYRGPTGQSQGSPREAPVWITRASGLRRPAILADARQSSQSKWDGLREGGGRYLPLRGAPFLLLGFCVFQATPSF